MNQNNATLSRLTNIPKGQSRRSWLFALSGSILSGISGCGYSVRPPYNREIQTVYVPIFRSLTFRRDLNLMLTEAVAKEIEKRTPYKVVGTPEGADSSLIGEVTFADKNLVVENPQNLPRQLSADLVVNMRWTDNRHPSGDPKDVGTVTLRETVTFSPEFGDTTMSAYQKACQKMAEQIASMMEQPW
ncbi:MAG: LPS assembly lipoprotein LptE [Planctomycetota bacterium]|nr:LPS assembly lipoprotein LptE [Planctomycetota bacterium]RLT13045.1 MAG: hypothetical protein DWI24_05070 [Planctomycetota bacterium]